MKSKGYDRKVILMCPTCGESQFEYDSDCEIENMELKCISCEQTYSRDELMKENGEIFEEKFQEIGEGILEDAAQELKKAFKKGFN